MKTIRKCEEGRKKEESGRRDPVGVVMVSAVHASRHLVFRAFLMSTRVTALTPSPLFDRIGKSRHKGPRRRERILATSGNAG